MIEIRPAMIKMGYRWVQPQSHLVPFKLTKIKGIKFTKKYSTSIGNFEILLIVEKTDLTKLPLAYILNKPSELQHKALPHIRNDGYLCYANNDQTEWNPNAPFELAQAIDESIANTLLSSIANINNPIEYRNEFTNYWDSHFIAYNFQSTPIPKKHKNMKYCSFRVINGSQTFSTLEYVLFSDEKDRERWLALRSVKNTIDNGDVIVVTVKKSQWAPESDWPPSSLRLILNWLKQVDINARDFLIHQLIKLAVKKIVVVLEIAEEGLLGFEVVFSHIHHNMLVSLKSRKASSIKLLIEPISSDKAVKRFNRHHIEQIDRDSIFLRNRPIPEIGDIRNLRIALIGCGTIGGFVAEHLVKIGAGIGSKGNLTLYDSDHLRPGNLSRHRLPTKYIGWNKADALYAMLSSESLYPINLMAKDEDFPINIDILKKYDVIIDTTGRAPVSLKIASVSRMILEGKRPSIIHSFNDMLGKESVVLIDTGKACYGCLDKFNPQKEVDPKFDPSRYSCGNIYTPYDAAVSIVSAGLVSEAVLSLLEQNQKWTLTRVISSNTNSQKRQVLKSWSECSICK